MTEKVKVKSYYRGGDKVRSHTRSLPEGGGVKISQVLASNSENNPEDTLMIKEALQNMGYYEPAKDIGMHSHPDSQLFDAVKEFQKDNNLKVDGIIKPNGETEKAINSWSGSAVSEGAKEVARLIKGVYDTYEAYKSFEGRNFIYDKYRHAYVSCKGAQNGKLAQKATRSMGNLLEWRQVKEGIDTVQESAEDLEANEYGLKVGRKYPNKDCDDLVKDKYDKNKYWRK